MRALLLLALISSCANAVPIFMCDVVIHDKPVMMLNTQHDTPTIKNGKYYYRSDIDNGRHVETVINPNGKGTFTVLTSDNKTDYQGTLDCIVMPD